MKNPIHNFKIQEFQFYMSLSAFLTECQKTPDLRTWYKYMLNMMTHAADFHVNILLNTFVH